MVDDRAAHPQMAECSAEKTARCSVMQACHIDFRQLSWTYHKKGASKSYEDSDFVVIPAGMTKLLQPLNVVIHHPFKVTFWQVYNQWITTTKHVLRPQQENEVHATANSM
jgi:hypothetical protein